MAKGDHGSETLNPADSLKLAADLIIRQEVKMIRRCKDSDFKTIFGVMGIQDKGEVMLIRHAYVRTRAQKLGIGTKLLQHLESMTDKPILIGTWAASTWAISFYEKKGYAPVSAEEKNFLLRKFWSIPERQVETSVVLANQTWFKGLDEAPADG